MPRIEKWGSTESGKGKHVRNRDVVLLYTAMDSVPYTTAENIGLPVGVDNPQKQHENTVLKVDTGLHCSSMKKWWQRGITVAIYAGKNLLNAIRGRIGTGNSVSTTATIQGRLEACSATIATSPLGMEKHLKYLNELQRISDFTADPIISITASGEEEVFDVEVDRTENFIANGVVSHNTRWSKRDLTGQVLKAAAQRGGEDWEVIEFPAILPSGNPLWPEFWTLKELEALREELPNSKWMAQYQQNPVSESSAIIKRDWWRTWESDTPPQCDFILMSWDTAFEKTQRADYSALTTWGVFHQPDDTGTVQTNIILLNAFRERMEFPRLKQAALNHYKDWKPDSIIIEKKASGAPLIYEMRAMGIPVQEFTPNKGNDKISRLNAVADLFASGRVWAPNTHWAEEVIEEVASFPSGEHDDYVDATSLALSRLRLGGFVSTELDEPEPVRQFKSLKHRGYY